MARNMYPSCETVEYASTFLMSFCATAMVAANTAVSAPVHAITADAPGASAYRKPSRQTM